MQEADAIVNRRCRDVCVCLNLEASMKRMDENRESIGSLKIKNIVDVITSIKEKMIRKEETWECCRVEELGAAKVIFINANLRLTCNSLWYLQSHASSSFLRKEKLHYGWLLVLLRLLCRKCRS